MSPLERSKWSGECPETRSPGRAGSRGRSALEIGVAGLRILDGDRAQFPGRRASRLGRAGDEDPGTRFGREGRAELETLDPVVTPGETDRSIAGQQALDDHGGVDEPVIAGVVLRVVSERCEVPPEAAADHADEHAPAVEVAERGDHRGHAVRVHAGRLDRHERAEAHGASAGDVARAAHEVLRRHVGRLRRGREWLDLHLAACARHGRFLLPPRRSPFAFRREKGTGKGGLFGGTRRQTAYGSVCRPGTAGASSRRDRPPAMPRASSNSV